MVTFVEVAFVTIAIVEIAVFDPPVVAGSELVISPASRLVVSLADGFTPRATVIPIIPTRCLLGRLRRAWTRSTRFAFTGNRPIVIATTSPTAAAAATAAPSASAALLVSITGFIAAAPSLAAWLVAGGTADVTPWHAVVAQWHAVVAQRHAVVALWHAVVAHRHAVVALRHAFLVEAAGRTFGPAAAIVPAALGAKLRFGGQRAARRRRGGTSGRLRRRRWRGSARDPEFRGEAVPVTGLGRGLGLTLLPRLGSGRLGPGNRRTGRVVGRGRAERFGERGPGIVLVVFRHGGFRSR
ncbi:MAG: hypothetical protein K8S94_05960 [Planctomycetia bacterium]|nr:hypothetical protein [Planctomycetia bacterium]